MQPPAPLQLATQLSHVAVGAPKLVQHATPALPHAVSALHEGVQ